MLSAANEMQEQLDLIRLREQMGEAPAAVGFTDLLGILNKLNYRLGLLESWKESTHA